MATRPKRRRKVQSPSITTQPSTSTNQAVEDLVRACMSSITPIIETTCRRVIEEKMSTVGITAPQTSVSSNPTPVVPTTDQSTSAEATPTLLQEITASGTLCSSLSDIPNLSEFNPSPTATLLTLGVDDKIRTKIHAGEYVKFSSLLPTDFTISESTNYKSIDKDGQLLFVPSSPWLNGLKHSISMWQLLRKKVQRKLAILCFTHKLYKKLLILAGITQLFSTMRNFGVGGNEILQPVHGI